MSNTMVTKPWDTNTAQHLQQTAWRLFSTHDCQGSRHVDMRENCGACMLAGYQPSRNADYDVQTEGPNYAGWARAYIQAGRILRSRATFKRLLRQELDQRDNIAYSDALLRDIVTFGLPWKPQYDLGTCPNRVSHHVGNVCLECGLVD